MQLDADMIGSSISQLRQVYTVDYYNKTLSTMIQPDRVASIRQLLKKMQSQKVSEAEKQLMTLSDHSDFLPHILHILSSASQDEWIKTVAASFLNMLLINNAEQHSKETSKVLGDILGNSSIKQMDKRSFEKAIIATLEHSSQELREDWAVLLDNFMTNKATFDSAYLIIGCFAVCDQITDQLMRKVVMKQFQPILSSLQVCVDNAYLLNQMIKLWQVVFDRFRNDQTNHQIAIYMATSRKMLDLLDLLLELQSPQGLFVCVIGGLQELNMLKYEAAQLLKRFLLFAQEKQDSCPALYDFTRKNMPRITQTLLSFAGKQSEMRQFACEDLLTTFFSIQHLYLSAQSQQFSLDAAIQIQDSIIYPYVRIADDQMESFEQVPAQFNSLAQDCAAKQVYGIMKTQAIKFLQRLADKVEGSLFYTLSRAIQSLKVKLGFVTQNKMQPPALQIQTAFCILSVFSYGLNRFPAQLQAIRVIMCDQRVKNLPPLQLARVFIFLAYNYSQVFKSPQQGQSWIVFAFKYQAHPTAKYCAFDFISNLCEDYFSQVFPVSVAQRILQNNVPLIWDIARKIIQYHYNLMNSQAVIMIMRNLYSRIQTEVVKIKAQQKNTTLDLINCLHLFQEIIQAFGMDQGQSQQKANLVLQAAWPLFDFLPTALQLDIQDQIVSLATQIINCLPSIPQQLWKLVPSFAKLFEKNHYSQKIYYIFFNQFIGKANFHKDKEALITAIITIKNALLHNVLKIAQEGIPFKNIIPDRLNSSNAMLVMQNIIAIHGNSLLQSTTLQLFEEVSSLCLRLLPKAGQKVQGSSIGRIVLSRALNTLLLCHMHLSIDCIYQFLQRLSVQNLYHGFDTRVLVMCIGKQIFRQSDPGAVCKFLVSLLNIVDKSIQKDRNIEQQRSGKGKMKNKKIKVAANMKKINDFDKILRKLNSPFMGQTTLEDELMQVFKKMHEENSQLLTQLTSQFPLQTAKLYRRLVPQEELLKKKRVIYKVVGIRDAAVVQKEQKEVHRKKQDMDEDSQEEVDLKRDRVIIKRKKKNQKQRKMNDD